MNKYRTIDTKRSVYESFCNDNYSFNLWQEDASFSTDVCLFISCFTLLYVGMKKKIELDFGKKKKKLN
jgi:hypothetical protein